MKGLVLAGGAGSRLRPITYTRAKQLIPVANKPVMFYGLEQLAAAGIREVAIVVGDTEDEVRDAVGDGGAFGLEVTYLRQEAPLGLAHAVLIARDFLGDDDVIMYLGDNLLRDGVASFVAGFEASRAEALRPRLGEAASSAPAARILLAHVDDPSQFGVAELGPDGQVKTLHEKPAEPPSDLALVGVYLFDPTIHEAVRSIEPSARGELEITDAIDWLIEHGHRVTHEVLDGWWKDTGTLEPLLAGNRLLLETLPVAIDGSVDDASSIEGRVVLEAGAEVKGSTIRGPVTIASGARIIDSYVGPFTSIGPGCEVLGSEVEHSILLADSRVVGIGRLVDSLIGREAVVTRSSRRPRAIRLMLGDDSCVDLDG